MRPLKRCIRIRGARTHNLKDVCLDLPHGKLTVVTGVSGSGKSSLVFDTLYAEGQRRYVQSLSTYARLFLERIERPDVDTISDIPPALALRQKNTIRNARSTAGTVTEINDYLRLLFATAGVTRCPGCGGEVGCDTPETAAARVLGSPGLYLFVAPYRIDSRPVHSIADYLVQSGYHRLYEDGAIVETADFVERFPRGAGAPAAFNVVIDRVAVESLQQAERVREALERAFYVGGGRCRAVRVVRSDERFEPAAELVFDRRFNCARCDRAFPEPSAALFSFNSPIGACPQCEGFGRIVELDLEKVMPDHRRSLSDGLVAPWRTPAYREMQQWMLSCARRARVRRDVPFADMSETERNWLLHGEADDGAAKGRQERWPGVLGFFRWLEKRRYKTHIRILLARYRRFVPCSGCGGTKLRPEALNVRVNGRTIAELGQMPIRDLEPWLARLHRNRNSNGRVNTLLRELINRTGYLNRVGLGYLTLERQARTLSGGEAQRIHLASALGSLLTGTLYALDEPTVGLHAADAHRLLEVLRRLRDLGNTVVVVEHDPALISGADFLVTLGPGGGWEGGRLLAARAPQRARRPAAENSRALLLRALAREYRFRRGDPALRIVGAREHNLRAVDVWIPLSRLVCVTGVSGSGKSTLVENVLYGNYLRANGDASVEAGACDRIDGWEQVGQVVHLGQELPARSMRSNVATYLKFYDEIRKLLASTTHARRLGITARHFSVNVPAGRCERCQGTGTVTIEMHFMADLEVRCEVCEGRRFQSSVLGVTFQGKNVNQILELTVDEACDFFARNLTVVKRLKALQAVGLGYVALGQTTSTLSGGEAQRLKLARFLLADLEPPPHDSEGRPLARVFLLDEPTTGLSSSDVKRLMSVLGRLVRGGDTVVVIEHNLEVIAQADYVIDLGPGGGDEGGRVVVAGSPLKVAACARSRTGTELARLIGLARASGAGAGSAAARSARA